MITTKSVDVGKGMKRGFKEWLNIYVLHQNLREAMVERIIPILHLNRDVDVLFFKNIFEQSQELVDAVAELEEEVLRDFGPIETTKRLW